MHAAGFRACFPIAFSFVYVHGIFRNSVHRVDGQGGSLQIQQRAFAKGDAVVVASFAPYSHEAMQVAEAAKAAGASLLASRAGQALVKRIDQAEAQLFRPGAYLPLTGSCGA